MKTRTMMMALAMTLWLGAGFTAAQAGTPNHPKSEGEKIIRGERPPINYNNLDDDAWEKGVLLIKFVPEKTRHLEENPATLSREGIATFALEEVDRLATLYGVRDARQHFRSQAFNSSFTERHKAWGFHLWYKLQLDEGSSIIEAVRAFAGLREVEIAEPVFKIELHEGQDSEGFEAWILGDGGSGGEWIPNDPSFSEQWHYHNTGQGGGTPGADISLIGAWAIEKGHPDVIVAVIDTGIQFDHEDLAANMWEGIGYNFFHDSDVIVPSNHGTHVAGTVAAVNNNNKGVAGIAGGSGGNDGIRLMSCQIFDGNSSPVGFHLAPIWAADHGAAITQNSYGAGVPHLYNQAHLDAIDYFNQHGGGEVMNGGITIFAVGNSNDNGAYYPGFYSGTLAVAATDRDDVKSSFSNYGSWVDISAPGTSVLSTRITNTYGFGSGTSMACPHVSGVAALILSYAHSAGIMLDNTDLWDLLVSTTDNIDHLNPSYAGLLGSGRLNAQQALEATHAFISNVAVPASFIATLVGANVIELEWQPNSDNDSVLIAYSESGLFGIPSNGLTYSPGDIISGGGSILHYGSEETSLMHTGLNFLSNYYYRAWSYNGAEYSGHRVSQATTLCPDAYPLPLFEDFDSHTEIPVCWAVTDSHPTSTGNWSIGTFPNGLTGTTGNYAWVEMAGSALRTSILVSPFFDFSGYDDVEVSFKHRYNHAHATAIFAFSTDDGSSWQTIESWGGNTGTATFSQQLGMMANQSNVQFGWILETRGTGPNHAVRSWSVDDIQITATAAGVTYTIMATAGNGGSISPAGNVVVGEGNNQSFSISANGGFEIADVLVDNVSVGAVNSYTFSNVSSDHSIHATFEELPVVTYVITASSGPDGSIDPTGEVTVVEGSNQIFNFIPNSGYVVENVVVDNVSLGALSSYTFQNVSANHAIYVSFELAPEDPCKISSLPHLEDFNAVAAIPDCWQSVVNDGNVGWEVGSFNGGLSGATGNYAYFHYQGNQRQNADLISPSFDFSDYSDIGLSFTHYYAADRSSVGLYYSLDNGSSWNAIQTWSNSTSNPAAFSQALPALAGQADVKFRWNMDFTGGGPPRNSRSWSVDDILVTGTPGQKNNLMLVNATEHNALSGKIEMFCYPNPAKDLLNLRFNRNIESGLLIVTDMQGRQIQRMEIRSLLNGNKLQLDISHFANGPYIIKVLYEAGFVNQVIMKQ